MTLPDIYAGPGMKGLTLLEESGAVTPTGFVTKKLTVLSDDEYASIGAMLGHIYRHIEEKRTQTAWLIGDWLNHGEKVYGEEFYQVAEVLKLRPQTLTNRRSICDRIPRSRRRENVDFSTHAEVAYLTPTEQEAWLQKAEEEDWSARRLRAEIKSPNGDGSPGNGNEVVCTCPNCGLEHTAL